MSDTSSRVVAPKVSKMKIAVCVAVMDKEDRVLVTRRARGLRHFPGCWFFPGGHLELGESLEAGGLRELDEETGIRVDIEKCDELVKYTYECMVIPKP